MFLIDIRLKKCLIKLLQKLAEFQSFFLTITRKKKCDNHSHALRFAQDCNKTQETCHKAVDTYHSAIKFVPECNKIQEMWW